MSRLMTWLQRRPSGQYRVRVTIPPRLRRFFGERTILTKVLGTADPQVAKRRAVPVMADFQRRLQEAEAALTNPAVAAYRAVQDVRASNLGDDEQEALDSYLTTKLEEDHPDSATYRVILNRTGDPPLSVLFDRWRIETSPAPKTAWEWDRYRKRFTKLALSGADLPIGQIQRAHVVAWKDALLTQEDLSPKTVNKAIAVLRSVFAFGINNGLMVANPAAGVRVSRRRANGDGNGETLRLPYTLEEARALLDAARHLDVKTDSLGRTCGADRWLPWLAAYSGCRLAEAAGLRSEDVKQVEGTWCMVIEDSPVRRIKTASSRRTVALAPALLEAGFLQHVETNRDTGRVFPDVTADRHGVVGAAWSKSYARWARTIVPDRRKVFHSWRHLVEDRLRDAGVPEDQRDAVLGHSSSRMGRRYGAGYSVAVLFDAVKEIKYD